MRTAFLALTVLLGATAVMMAASRMLTQRREDAERV
jgi:hypothetical protein